MFEKILGYGVFLIAGLFGTHLLNDVVKEVILLLVCVAVGTGGMVSFKSRTTQITFGNVIASFFMGIFVGTLSREVALIFEWYDYKIFMMILGSALSEYIIIWFDKRNTSILDWLLKFIKFLK